MTTHLDSIEKFDPHSEIEGEAIPYLMASTTVIQNIKDPIAGFVWIYLLSKPKNWTVVKEHIKNHFNLGDDRIKAIFSYLRAHNLIEYVREKDDNGKFVKVKIRVLNGSRFITNPDEGKPPVDNPSATGVKTTPVENHTCGKQATTKNRTITKERSCYKEKKKQKSFYENNKKHSFAQSMDQSAREREVIKQHEVRKEAEVRTRMPDYLREKLGHLRRGMPCPS